MKIEYIATHKELKCLDWSYAEFSKLVYAGEIRRPSAYKPMLKISAFGFSFKLPVPCVYFVDIGA